MNESLENLKVGDKVFYDGKWGACWVVTVARLTAKQIIIKNGTKFWKESGRSVGGGDWNFTSLRPLTPERIERVEIRKLVKEVTALRYKLSTPQDKETLIKLIAALKPFV